MFAKRQTVPRATVGTTDRGSSPLSRPRPGLPVLWAMVVGLLLVLTFSGTARAGVYVWKGAAPVNTWSAASNWEGNVAPNIGDAVLDTLVFPLGAQELIMINDFPDGTAVARLVFNDAYTLNGTTRLRIRDTIDVNLAANGSVDINVDLTLDGLLLPNVVVISNNRGLRLNGVISGSMYGNLRKEGAGILALTQANTYLGGTTIVEGRIELLHAQALGSTSAGTTVAPGGTLRLAAQGMIIDEPVTLTGPPPASAAPSTLEVIAADGNGDGTVLTNVALAGDGDPVIGINSSSTLTIVGPISGPSGLRKSGPGTLALTGSSASTYTGVTTVASGQLVLANNGQVAVPNGLDILSGTVRLMSHNAIEGGVRVEPSATLNLNGWSDGVASLNSSGSVELGAGTLLVGSGAPSSFAGVISGSGALVKSGPAQMTLASAQTFTGGMLMTNAGRLRLHGSLACGLEVSGVLDGSGMIHGPLLAHLGTVTPGTDGPGVLRTQMVTLEDAVTFHVDVNGPITGPESDGGHDQLQVTGGVTLTFPVLALSVGAAFVPTGEALVIIDNDGTDPVAGTFASLPEGATITSGGRAFRLSYAGGTGNDVTLTSLVTEYHLSEGATGGFFDTDLLIANPHDVEAPVEITYLRPGGAVLTQTMTVAAASRATIRVDEVPGLQNAEVSFIVTSVNLLPLVVERTMRWDATGYGAHTEKAVGGPSERWYFAEGSQGFFSTYLLLANPHASANAATVTYLREGATPVVRAYPLDPTSRVTIDVGADPDLVGQSFGMTVAFVLPGVAERSMYFGQQPLWNAGHESAGVPNPSTSWFLAEGATGPFFETFVLLANPNDAPAEVTVTYLPDSGVPIVKTKSIPAAGRLTINVEGEDPALANAAVATRVQSSLPIVVERAQYWPDPFPQWYEAHNSFGVTAAATSWGLAEGRVGGPEAYQTYILIANPGDQPATVTLRFLREGKPAFMKTFTVAATSRFNVSTGPGSLVPELENERFGAAITASAPVVIERAMYADAGGQLWGAGTNATATHLP